MSIPTGFEKLTGEWRGTIIYGSDGCLTNLLKNPNQLQQSGRSERKFLSIRYNGLLMVKSGRFTGSRMRKRVGDGKCVLD